VPGRSDENGGERICVCGYPAFLFKDVAIEGFQERMKRVWHLVFLYLNKNYLAESDVPIGILYYRCKHWSGPRKFTSL